MGILGSIINYLPQILVALLVFGVLIFVHEFGHFIAAKQSGIKVNEFAMGMGPTILKRQKGETVYALRLFPIGGFCAMEGADEESEDARAFGRAPLLNRMIVILAGSAMNLLLGLIIFGILSTWQPMLTTTVVDRFAKTAVTNQWLQAGDKIRKINNHAVRSSHDVGYELMRDRDGVMDILVARPTADGKTENVLLRAVAFQMEDFGEGVSMPKIDFAVKGVEPTFLGVVQNSIYWTGSTVKQVWGSLADLVTGRFGMSQLSGPVGITKVVGEAAKQASEKTPEGAVNKAAIEYLLNLIAFITVNLGVFNLLPLPALDGGRFIFLAIEAVRRKPVDPRYEGYVHGVGFMLLIGLIIFATFNDIARII